MPRKYVITKPWPRKICSECGKPAKGLGFCSKHYQNFKRLGKAKANQNKCNSVDDFLREIHTLESGESGCKLWKRGTDKDGYGYYAIDGITYGAHRLLYKLSFPGEYSGMVVMHICDNPKCCNIEHLRIGTPSQNTYDMIKKSRNVRGERVGTSRLSEAQVLDIRSTYHFKSATELAQEYGVCKQTICNVLNGATYVNEDYKPVNRHVRIEI